jgi:HD superfamily phosphohydrolase
VNSQKAAIPLVVRELSDKQMLQYMGRENMEDFTSFSVLLETWEAATNYMALLNEPEIKAIEIGKLLGWVKNRAGKYRNDESVDLNSTAQAANGHAKPKLSNNITTAVKTNDSPIVKEIAKKSGMSERSTSRKRSFETHKSWLS